MNSIENTILVLDSSRSKYGWTENTIAKGIYEVLKNEQQLLQYMMIHQKTYLYMLKYFIQKGLTSKFKKYFEITDWKNENIQALEYLLSLAAKYNRAAIFFYLIEKHYKSFDFSNIKKLRYYLYDVNDRIYNRHYEIFDYSVRQFVFKNELNKYPLSVLETLSTIIYYDKDLLLQKIFDRAVTYKDLYSDKINGTFQDALKVLNIECHKEKPFRKE